MLNNKRLSQNNLISTITQDHKKFFSFVFEIGVSVSYRFWVAERKNPNP